MQVELEEPCRELVGTDIPVRTSDDNTIVRRRIGGEEHVGQHDYIR